MTDDARRTALVRLGYREPKIGDVVRLDGKRIGVITDIGNDEFGCFMASGAGEQRYRIVQLYEDGWSFG